MADILADIFLDLDTHPTPTSAKSPSAQCALFARESIAQAFDEAVPLIFANQAETGEFHDAGFHLLKDVYAKADATGKLRVFTMRIDGKLIGYQTFSITPHPRHPGVTLAIQDVVYVAPEHRGFAVLSFFKFVDGELESEGFKPVRHNNAKKDHARLLAHLGYRKTEETWIKD